MVKAYAADLTEEELRLALVDNVRRLFYSRSSSEDQDAFPQALSWVQSARAAKRRLKTDRVIGSVGRAVYNADR